MTMSPHDKPLIILSGEIKTPPLSSAARIEAGYLLRSLQRGDLLTMPHSRPMPAVGRRCHELRVDDAVGRSTWRIIYRVDPNAVLVVDVFSKKTQTTPIAVMESCRRRLAAWDSG
jgi:phage-related protein